MKDVSQSQSGQSFYKRGILGVTNGQILGFDKANQLIKMSTMFCSYAPTYMEKMKTKNTLCDHPHEDEQIEDEGQKDQLENEISSHILEKMNSFYSKIYGTDHDNREKNRKIIQEMQNKTNLSSSLNRIQSDEKVKKKQKSRIRNFSQDQFENVIPISKQDQISYVNYLTEKLQDIRQAYENKLKLQQDGPPITNSQKTNKTQPTQEENKKILIDYMKFLSSYRRLTPKDLDQMLEFHKKALEYTDQETTLSDYKLFCDSFFSYLDPQKLMLKQYALINSKSKKPEIQEKIKSFNLKSLEYWQQIDFMNKYGLVGTEGPEALQQQLKYKNDDEYNIQKIDPDNLKQQHFIQTQTSLLPRVNTNPSRNNDLRKYCSEKDLHNSRRYITQNYDIIRNKCQKESLKIKKIVNKSEKIQNKANNNWKKMNVQFNKII